MDIKSQTRHRSSSPSAPKPIKKLRHESNITLAQVTMRKETSAKDSKSSVKGLTLNLTCLPSEVLELIAFFCAISTPKDGIQNNRPQDQSAAAAVEAAHAHSNHGVYSPSSSFYKESFQRPPPAYATPPANLYNLLLTCRKLYTTLCLSRNPRLYAKIFMSRFDVAAISRRFGKEALSSKNLANELPWRCFCLKRIRKAVRNGEIYPKNMYTESMRHEVLENLWLAFMMLMENDGLNMLQLKWAQIEIYLKLHQTQELLETTIYEGYPPNTADRALSLHLSYLLTDPESFVNESRDESDERLFMLRPYVFAAHKYDAYFAPWTKRHLPIPPDANLSNLTEHQHPTGTTADPFVADDVPKALGQKIHYCGHELTICPPIITLASCLYFFMKVEQDPAATGFNSIPTKDWDSPHKEVRTFDQQFSIRNPLFLRSIDHDKDVERMLSCTSPYLSAGLSLESHIGSIDGAWEGRFTFFDFDSYRDMLSGKIRSLYEGPFGEQPQVWKIREHIVEVDSEESMGGSGSLLNSGFLDSEEPYRRSSISPHEFSFGGIGRANHNRNDADQKVTTSSSSKKCYEILLSGTGHSAWGRFILRGRVRTWDGLITITKEYRPDGRGRWLYRGYIVAGNKFVGRWRDTFTPEDMCGYEGCFLLHRRS